MAYGAIAETVVRLFAHRRMQGVARRATRLLLRAQGYANDYDLVGSGEMRMLKSVLSRGPALCLDIGANVGDYAEVLLSGSSTRVIAFEPLPANVERLASVADKYPGRLTIVAEGLASEPGEADLHHGPGECQLASIYPEVSHIKYVGDTFDRVTRIKITTIDEYFSQEGIERPDVFDLVKVDCEGAEFDILLGGQKTFAEIPPKFIQIEFNRHHLFSKTSLREIASLFPNYSVWQVLPRNAGMVRRDPDDNLSNIYERSNWIFVRPGVDPP